MLQQPTKSPRTAPRFPVPTLFRSGENSRQRLQLQVARRHGACAGARLLDRALVAPGVQELLPHVSDDALPARRPLIVVVGASALGVLAAGDRKSTRLNSSN